MKAKLLLTLLVSCFSLGALAEGVEPIDEVFEPKGKFPKETFVKVAVVAINPSVAPVPATAAQAEQVKQQNRERLKEQIVEAANNGAEIVITPEFGIVGYPDIAELPPEEDDFRNPDDVEPYVEMVEGPSFEFFSELAKEHKIYIQYGLATKKTEDTKDFYNTAVVVNPKGQLVAAYDKVNLYQLENNFLKPGKDIAIYNTPAGRFGIIICADVYSSGVLSKYQGRIDVLALSTSWAAYNSGMSTFVRTARSYQVHLLAANQMYFPDSGVINPDGSKQSHIRQSDGIAYGYLPRKNAEASKVKPPRARK